MDRSSAARIQIVLVFLSISLVSADLVAFYNFDGSYGGVSGYCFSSLPTGLPVGKAKIGSVQGKFTAGLALSNYNDYMVLDGLSLFPSASSSAFSVAAWIKLNRTGSAVETRTIVRKDSFIKFQLSSATGAASVNFALSCQIWFSNSVSSTVNTIGTAFKKTTTGWSHVACIYNTTHLCVAYNGTVSACNEASARQISPSSGRLFAGYTTDSLRGTLDELKFYDHALTANQLSLLYGATNSNDVPTAVAIGGEGLFADSLSAAALTSVLFNSTGSDGRLAYSGTAGETLFYSWNILSSLCGMATISDSSAQNSSLSLLNLGSFILQLCVTDGELSAGAQAQVLVTASDPIIEFQPTLPEVAVPLGSVVSLSVSATGVPPPSYQWQYLTYENRTIVPSNSTHANSTIVERAWQDFEEGEGEEEEEEGEYEEEPYHWFGDRAEPQWEIVEVWLPIEGAQSNAFLINGTHDRDNQTIRCLVTNSGGSIGSEHYTINIVAASPSASPSPSRDSDSSTNVGAIVGGVVGGTAGLFCLLLVLLAVLALALARRSGRRQKKLNQPDYVALAYGDVDNVSLPKKKVEHLGRLEKLLFAQNGRIAHAMFATASTTDADKVCKAVMCVYESHHKGFELLEQRITDEVAAASDEGTLFRANSLAAKMFGSYVKMVALPYLWFTLVTSVNSLNDNAIESFGEETGDGRSRRMRYRLDRPDDYEEEDGSGSGGSSSGTGLDVFSVSSSMEIDPHKMDDASDSTINSLELWLVAQKLFKCIINSERLMPAQIKRVLSHIDSEVGTRFSGQAQFRALGGFLFLRMVCPALMAPQVFGLLESPPHPVAQRQFILVSKVLQNLANDTLPGTKENYMEQLNSFISTNKAGLESFYHKVVSGTARGKAVMTADVPVKAKQRSLVVLQRYLEANLAAVERVMLDDGYDEQLVEQLKETLGALGDDGNV